MKRLPVTSCFAYLLLMSSAAAKSVYEEPPAWVAALAVQSVQRTSRKDVKAGGLRMYVARDMSPTERDQVQFVLSPDGEKVLLRVAGKEKGAESLWLGRRGESEPVHLLDERWGMSAPVWSPDGSRIAYVRRMMSDVDLTSLVLPEMDTPAYVLVVATIETSTIREVTPPWYYSAQGFGPIDWGPDGQTIAFSACFVPITEGHHSEELYLATVSSASPTIRRLTYNDTEDQGPTFSPDGSRIAFARRVFPPGFNKLMILDLVTGEERAIVGGEFREGTRWRLSAGGAAEWWPDGNGINFWAGYKAGPPPKSIHFSYNLVTGASEVIETR